MKNTIIFDFDGTLVDTIYDLMDSVNYGLEKCGLEKRSYEEIKSFVGNGVYNLVFKSVPTKNIDKVDEVYNFFKEYYSTHKMDKARVYDGIIELIKELKNKGFKIGVASNKYDLALKEMVDYLLPNLIDFSLGEINGIKRKPEPDIIFEVLRKLNSSVDESYYIGDSEVDYKTSINAGIDAIFVSWGFRGKNRLIEIGAEVIVDSPKEILDIIMLGENR